MVIILFNKYSHIYHIKYVLRYIKAFIPSDEKIANAIWRGNNAMRSDGNIVSCHRSA